MCTFEFKVLLCGCECPICAQRGTSKLEKYLPRSGHIIRITSVRRISGMCLGWFINTDPNRLVVRWGYPAENGNSKPDCNVAKKITFHRDFERTTFCDACLKTCEQPASVARLLRSTSPEAKAERIKRGLEKKSEEEPKDIYMERMKKRLLKRLMKEAMEDAAQGKPTGLPLSKEKLEELAAKFVDKEEDGVIGK